MARERFYSQLVFEPGTQSTDGTVKSQLDAAYAAAISRANHTGLQSVATLSDFTTSVNTLISAVIDGAPGALDTLNELAAALGDDPDFAATVATQLTSLDGRLDTVEAAQGSTAGHYKANVGDGIAATFTLTHSLASFDVRVVVVDTANQQDVHPVITRPSINTVTLDFGATVIPANPSHRVLVSTVPGA